MLFHGHGHRSIRRFCKEHSTAVFEKHFEFSAMKKDRSNFPMELSVTPVKLHDNRLYVSCRKGYLSTENSGGCYKQEKDMLENMAASMDAGLTLISRDYRILWANQLLKKANSDLENKLCYSIYDQSNKNLPGLRSKKSL